MVSALTSGLGPAGGAAPGGPAASGPVAGGGRPDVLWICAAMSDADRAAAASGVQDGDPPVKMLDIPPDVFEQAYNGVANSVLWFVHHMLFDTPNQPRFGPGFHAEWGSYAAYNEAFADALAASYEPGGRVLIQDYHLTLAPRLLRDRRPDARIAHFSHSPWAPPDYYRMLPDEVAAAVCDGILGADHAGFLSARWSASFLDCCESVLGAVVQRREAGTGLVSYRDRITEVAVHPLGVDVAALRERGNRDDVNAQVEQILEATGGRKLIVRVDRTELSKNIVRGLEAFRELLKTYPSWRERVTHVAFAYPSRSALPEYRAYTDGVRELAAAINDEFQTADWEPVLLEVKDDYSRSLAAYRVADVLLANPIRDGMNLVAEEGPVLSDRGCALVLSREAGAAGVFGADGLLVNPYDITMTAEALRAALEMPADERRRRCESIAATAESLAPRHWVAAQLAALA